MILDSIRRIVWIFVRNTNLGLFSTLNKKQFLKKPLSWDPGMCLTNAPKNAYSSMSTTALKHDELVFLCQGQTVITTLRKVS